MAIRPNGPGRMRRTRCGGGCRAGRTEHRRAERGRAGHGRARQGLRQPRGQARGARPRARQHLPGQAHRADEAAGHLRPGHPRAVGRRPGQHTLLRADHRGAIPRLDEPGRGDGRAHGGGQAAAGVRDAGAEGRLPAADGHRRAARHDGADRAGRRVRPAGDADGSPAGRGRLRHQRVQDVDHQRPAVRADRAAVQDRPGGQARARRHQHHPGRTRSWLHRLPRPAQAGLQGGGELRAQLLRLPGPGERAAGRARGRGVRADDARPGDRQDPGRRPRAGRGPGRAGRLAAVRAAAGGVRRSDLEAPVDRQLPGRHGDQADRGPPGRHVRGALLRLRAARGHGGRHGQAVRLGDRDGDRAERGPDPRRLRLLHRVRRGALLPGRAADDRGRGHQRDPAQRHRPPARPAPPGGLVSGAGPLDGLLVVALEQAVAAPFATRQLADLGARVIKIERAGAGDVARGYDTSVLGQASYFVWLNRGKESVELDVKSDEGRAAMTALLARADVFVQNLAPGAAARLGLGAAELLARHPRLICCAVSGYGPDGPYAGKKAYDLLVQCEAGLLSVTGTPEAPSKAGISVADIATGMYAYTGVLTALYERERTGRGSSFTVSLLDALGEWITQPYLYTVYGGREPRRTGARHASISPYGPYQARGGEVFIGLQNEREWAVLCDKVLARSDLITDERFITNPDRVKDRKSV